MGADEIRSLPHGGAGGQKRRWADEEVGRRGGGGQTSAGSEGAGPEGAGPEGAGRWGMRAGPVRGVGTSAGREERGAARRARAAGEELTWQTSS